MVLTFECETECTEYLKETEESFFIYWITQNWIMIKPNVYEFDRAQSNIHKNIQLFVLIWFKYDQKVSLTTTVAVS